MKKRTIPIVIITVIIAVAVLILVLAIISFRKGASSADYAGITKETTITEFQKQFPDSERKGYCCSFRDFNLTRWDCASGDIRAITGQAGFDSSTEVINTITLNVYPEGVEEGKGNEVFKKIVGYFTKNLGQADSINDIETDYMWMKPDINVAISYSTGQIKMRYYYNFSMGEE